MSDNLQQQRSQTRQNCCRLCLAPNSECISIINSFAADKEPLITKIQNCVSLKISTQDRLSLCVCHACISYLNSWQSFKNRCLAAQTKQLMWLGVDANKNALKNDSSTGPSAANADTPHENNDDYDDPDTTANYQDQSHLSSSILDGISTLKKRKSLTVYSLPAVQIKDEPLDEADEYKQEESDDMMVDPTMFLERNDEEGDETLMDNSVGGGGSAFDYQQPLLATLTNAAANISAGRKEASCRACNLKFSTRANARRHERNLHPNLFELASDTANNTLITKPTPALAAALELQRAAANAAAVEATKTGISPHKLRQEVLNAFNKCESGGFDYENPEKYQHLLTDEKIVFIQQNEEFLQQYQRMTCRCCNKHHSTYKNFMAHMRKKYATLPRNLCFNCLKLNDSKALFISHLKRRNCINLYRVMHTLMAKNPQFAAAVNAATADAPEKMRAKQLLVNKMYECKLCPKHFRLKHEFRTHVYDKHGDVQRKDNVTSQCSFCGLELEDPVERKRHVNNMDCIVNLRCVTCDSKFDNNQEFMKHVYDTHLRPFEEQQLQLQSASSSFAAGGLQSADNSPGKKSVASSQSHFVGGGGGASSADESRSHQSSSHAPKSQYQSRMPQSCPICGQQYNNYNNVLRHMESKHPDQLPQTYKCVKCGVGYPRLSNLREHMMTKHSDDQVRPSGFEYIVNSESSSKEKQSGGSSSSNAYTGRYDYVMKDLMSITNGGSGNGNDDNDEDGLTGNTSKRPRLDNSSNQSSVRECTICGAHFSNNIGLSNHMRSHQAASQNSAAAAAALSAAARSTPKSLTITALPASATNTPTQLKHQTLAQQAMFRRSLEQAADRRFRRMRCRICQRRFSSKKSYRTHMLNDHNVHNVQFIKCKLCDAEFAYEKGLKVHMFKIHNTLMKEEMLAKSKAEADEQAAAAAAAAGTATPSSSSSTTASATTATSKQPFECDICSIVYRSDEQLKQHKQAVHGSAAPLYWYQCKYCPSNFNSNKKLAIHINAHDEFDSHDYSCKDCGNVYSGRKSLWVHRYKKHPQFAVPSECVLCKKVFFDAQMLENHIPSCNRKPITASGAQSETTTPTPSVQSKYRHQTGDDEDDEDGHGDDESASRDANDSGAVHVGTLGGGQVDVTKIKLPEVACTMCGARFSDQELFAKHIQKHEAELYTDNPLAAMFDTGPADPNQFYLDRVNDNGDYACDLCTKAFNNLVALKVHRKWHFRGDSKQTLNDSDSAAANSSLNSSSTTQQQQQRTQMTNHLHQLGLQAVGLMPKSSSQHPNYHHSQSPHNQSSSKSLKRKRELKCDYCPSTFISNNNLRRHLYELHKDEVGHLPQPPLIECDDNQCCRRCDIKFATKQEWIDHKVAEARVMKPFGPFQWGCDLCGLYVSRKEKLINHINNHMKEQEIVPVQQLQANAKAAGVVAEKHLLKQRQQQQQRHEEEEESTNNNNNNNIDVKKEAAAEAKDQSEQHHFGEVTIKSEIIEEEDYVAKTAAEKVAGESRAVSEANDDDDDEEEAGAEEAEVATDSDDDEDDDDDDEDDDDDDEDDDDDDDDDDEREMVEPVVDVNENANHMKSASNADDDDDDGVGDDDEDDDVDVDTNDDETNDVSKPVSHATDSRGAKSTTSATTDDSPSYDEDDEIEIDAEAEAEAEAAAYAAQRRQMQGGDDDDDDDDELEIDEDDDIVEDNDDDDSRSRSLPAPIKKHRFSCELCSNHFESQADLQHHVKMHFLNGPGSVSLTGMKPKSSGMLKSRSSSSGTSDVVAVSSS